MNGYNNGYTLFLPIETKGFLEPWLNSQFEDTESLFMMETPDNKNKSRTFVENIIKQLQLQSKATENNSMKQKLFKTSLNISDTFMKDPMVMYIGLRKWIAIERQLKKVPEVEYENYSHMFCLIQDVVTSVESNKDTLKKLNLFNNWLDDETSKKKSIMYQEQSLSLSLKVSDELKSIMKVTEDLLNRVIMFLKLWQNNEVGVRKGLLKSQTFALDIIQSWFEELADVLWNTRNHVSSLKTKEIAIHDELYRKVDNLLNQLIMHSFIVEEQPSLVLRTKTK